MKPLSFALFLVLIFTISCSDSDKINLKNIEQRIESIENQENATERRIAVNDFWELLKENQEIPYTEKETAYFVFKGEASNISFNGDFNNWGNDSDFQNEATKIAGTDFWYLKSNFPSDARFDYKVTLNNQEWILDPNNTQKQWSGFGPNSVLRMPKWEANPSTFINEFAKKGELGNYQIIDSKNLGYKVRYRIYRTPTFNDDNFENVLYVTDGHEYADSLLGKALIVLNNLSHLNKIEPVQVVFVEPLNPDDESENRRTTEFGMNDDYLNFYIKELIPTVERSFTKPILSENRGILGTSLGGLNSTYFGFSASDVFGEIAIQAPAFWFRDDIYNLVQNFNGKTPDIFMSVGNFGDNTADADSMAGIFEQLNFDFNYIKVNEGHSWGAWSAQLKEIFIQFYGK